MTIPQKPSSLVLLVLLVLLAASNVVAADHQVAVEGKEATGSDPKASVPGPMSFAVVIGNNKSLGARRPDLHYADDDAARYFEILQTLALGRVSLLADSTATRSACFRKPSVRPWRPNAVPWKV